MNSIVNFMKNKSIVVIVKGFITSMVITCILLLIYATILVNTNIKENTITPVILTITFISILIGSSLSCISAGKKGIINGLCIGSLYFTTLYLISCCFGMVWAFNLKSIIIVLIGIIFGIIGGIVGVNIRK